MPVPLDNPVTPGHCVFERVVNGWRLDQNHCNPGFIPDEPPNDSKDQNGTFKEFECKLDPNAPPPIPDDLG